MALPTAVPTGRGGDFPGRISGNRSPRHPEHGSFRAAPRPPGEDFLGAGNRTPGSANGSATAKLPPLVGEMPAGYQLAILSDPGRHLIMVVAANNDLGWSVPVIRNRERLDEAPLLTFSVLGVCVAFLALGVSQRGRRGRLGRRQGSIRSHSNSLRPNEIPARHLRSCHSTRASALPIY